MRNRITEILQRTRIVWAHFTWLKAINSFHSQMVLNWPVWSLEWPALPSSLLYSCLLGLDLLEFILLLIQLAVILYAPSWYHGDTMINTHLCICLVRISLPCFRRKGGSLLLNLIKLALLKIHLIFRRLGYLSIPLYWPIVCLNATTIS